MIKNYGYPHSILAYDKLISESNSDEVREGNFRQNLSKRSYSMKEASFEENPVFIIWKKAFYDIRLMFYYKEDVTQLTFRRPKAELF